MRIGKNDMRWVGSWTTAPVITEGLAFSNQTLRMILRVSLGGNRLRVRFSNAYGQSKLVIGQAHLALRDNGAGIVPGSDRKLTFNGGDSAAIAAGALILSDVVELDLAPLSDLAVSLYLPGDIPESFAITGHGNARQTGYVSPPGNFTAATAMPVQAETQSWYFVTGVEVMAPLGSAGLVAFGDSLTDANISTPDANHRWPDQLARRVFARSGGLSLGVMNQGLGGNRVLHDLRGDSGLRRFDRDVLAQPGVTHVIVMLGINDIRNRRGLPEEAVSAAEMIAGLRQLALRAHSRELKIFGGTLLPFENETFFPGAYTPEGDAKRREVNEWIRRSGAFDAVIDFEAALRDPEHPTRMLPIYDCGDHLHPSDRGYDRMGDIIDLSLFE